MESKVSSYCTKSIYILFTILSVLSVSFLVYSYVNAPQNAEPMFFPDSSGLNEIKTVTLNHYEDDKFVSESVDLPAKVDPSYTYSFDFTIPEAPYSQCLAVNLHYISFELKYGDELIYTNENYKNKFIKSIRNAFNLIEIPKKYTGKKLTIYFKSTLGDFRKLSIPVITYASNQALMESYMATGKYNLFFGGLLIVSAMFLLVSSTFFIKTNRSSTNTILVAAFAFVLGIYTCLRTWLVYYYIPDNGLIHFMDYTAILTMPITLYLFLINHFTQSKYFNWRMKLLKIGTIFTFASFCLQYILTFTGISEFVYFQKFSFPWIPISAVFIFAILLSSDGKVVENKRALVLSIAPILLISTITILMYFKTYKISFAFAIILSIVFFVLVNFVLTIKNDIKQYNKILENSFYEKLAYTDALTRINNRNSFEEEFEKINNRELEFKNIAIFMVDMNFLKYINDNIGHTEGDLYLKEIGNILNVIQDSFKNTKVYRYGGDEFIILSYNTTKNTINKIILTIEKLSEKFRGNYDFPLSLAVGVSFDTFSDDFDFNEALKYADENMYKDKSIKKKIVEEENINER